MILDIIVAVILILAVIKGYRQGLIVALFSFVAFAIGLAAAIKLSVVAAPITFPISAGEKAPTSLMIAATSDFNSSAESCLGKNFSIISISSCSFCARSVRFCC